MGRWVRNQWSGGGEQESGSFPLPLGRKQEIKCWYNQPWALKLQQKVTHFVLLLLKVS